MVICSSCLMNSTLGKKIDICLLINLPYMRIIYIYLDILGHRTDCHWEYTQNSWGSYGSGSERPWKAKSARSCWPWNKPPPTCWGSRVFFRNRELEELFGKTDTVEGRLQVCMFFLNLSVFFVFCTNRGNMLLCAWWPMNLNYRLFEWS